MRVHRCRDGIGQGCSALVPRVRNETKKDGGKKETKIQTNE